MKEIKYIEEIDEEIVIKEEKALKVEYKQNQREINT